MQSATGGCAAMIALFLATSRKAQIIGGGALRAAEIWTKQSTPLWRETLPLSQQQPPPDCGEVTQNERVLCAQITRTVGL